MDVTQNFKRSKAVIWREAVARGFFLLALSVQPVSAQDSDDVSDPDPIDTQYSTGLELMSADVKISLPTKPKYRSYLPKAVDLSKNMPRPGNQGRLGSCASWAMGYAARAYYTSAFEDRRPAPENIPSPRYLYHSARTGSCANGSSYEANARVLIEGVPSLKDVPYSEACTDAGKLASRAKKDFKIKGISNLWNVGREEIRGQIATGNPVIVSLRTNQAFDRLRRHTVFNDKSWTFSDNKSSSWHAIVVVGYDDTRQAVRIINSWGPGWGNNGYAWLSYDLISDPNWVSEAVVLDVQRPPPKPIPDLHVVIDTVKPDPPDTLPLPPMPSPQPSPKLDSRVDINKVLVALGDLRCSKLETAARDGRRIISGYVSSNADKDFVEQLSSRYNELSIENLFVAPWPACEVLETLSLPLSAADRPSIDLGGKTIFAAKEKLIFSVRSPSQFSYLYIAYLQADGSTVNLVQPSGNVPSQTAPSTNLRFGDGRSGRQHFEVTAPFGDEIIVAIASRSPLFENKLPSSQTDREYLTTIRRALAYKPTAESRDRVVSAAVISLRTQGP